MASSFMFTREALERVERAVAGIDAAIARLDDAPMSARSRTAVREELDRARQDLVSNLPFVARSFTHHVETTVERAKAEVGAYAASVLQRVGLAAIAANPVELLPGPVEPSADDLEGNADSHHEPGLEPPENDRV